MNSCILECSCKLRLSSGVQTVKCSWRTCATLHRGARLLVLAFFCLGSRYARGCGMIYLFTAHLQAVPYWVDDESVRPSMLMSAPAPKVQCQQRCSVVVVHSACS